MNPTNKIRLLDLQYLFRTKPETYAFYTEKLKERIRAGETIELIHDDSTSFQPADVGRFESFLKDEIESIVGKTVRSEM